MQFPPCDLVDWPESRKPLTLTSDSVIYHFSYFLLSSGFQEPCLSLTLDIAFSNPVFPLSSFSTCLIRTLKEEGKKRPQRRQRWRGRAGPKEGNHIIYGSTWDILRGKWGLLIITLGQPDINLVVLGKLDPWPTLGRRLWGKQLFPHPLSLFFPLNNSTTNTWMHWFFCCRC